MRVTEKKTTRNNIVKGVFRNAIKKTQEAVAKNSPDEAKKWLLLAIKSLDKAAEKNVIKKNAAARKKSRLNKLVKEAVLKK